MNYFINLNNAKSTTSKQQVELYEIKKNIDLGFEDTVDFHSVTVNGISQDLLIVHMTSEKYKKSIKSRPDETFNLGDVITWNGLNWIIIEVDADSQIYTKGVMIQCNYTLKFQLSNGTVQSVPALFESKSSSLDQTNVLTIPDGTGTIKLRFHQDYVDELVIGKRLLIDSRTTILKPNVYEISDAVLSSYDGGTIGILTLTLKKDTFKAETDSLVYWVADYFTAVVSSGTAEILYTGDCVIKVGGSFKPFTAKFTDVEGDELDLTPDWSITSSVTGAESNFVTVVNNFDKTLQIKCNDVSTLIGSTLTVNLTDTLDTYSSSIIIPVKPLY